MWLKTRIEQIIIGAVLSGRPLPAEAALLRPRDLEHHIGSHLLEDIGELREQQPRATADHVVTQIADRYAHLGLSQAAIAGWIHEPVPDHELAGGIRLFLHIGADREINEHATAITEALNHHPDLDTIRREHMLLDASIGRRFDTVAFATDTPDMDRRALIARLQTSPPLPADEPGAVRAEAEDTILSALMIHHDLCWAAAGTIDESTFTTSYRREVFAAISAIDRYAPCPDVDVEQRLVRTAGRLIEERSVRSGQLTAGSHELDRQYLQKLAELDTGRDTAIAAGRDLLADNLRHALEHRTWQQQPATTATPQHPDLIPPPEPPGPQPPQPQP